MRSTYAKAPRSLVADGKKDHYANGVGSAPTYPDPHEVSRVGQSLKVRSDELRPLARLTAQGRDCEFERQRTGRRRDADASLDPKSLTLP